MNPAMQSASDAAVFLHPDSVANAPQDVLSALSLLRNFLADAPSQIPPQIIIKGNGKKRAYGRNSLKNMPYEEAEAMLIDRFSIEDDWVKTPGGGRYPPELRIFATFCRTHGSGYDQGSVWLDASGWSELIENVERMRLVFVPISLPLPMRLSVTSATPDFGAAMNTSATPDFGTALNT